MGQTSTYAVAGMTCAHCVGAVTGEIEKVPGVRAVDVALVVGEASTVTITSDIPIDPADVTAAVEEAGYTLV